MSKEKTGNKEPEIIEQIFDALPWKPRLVGEPTCTVSYEGTTLREMQLLEQQLNVKQRLYVDEKRKELTRTILEQEKL